MLKKSLSVVVLSIFLVHFAGFYIYFFVQLRQVRQEMRLKLKAFPEEKLELIKLSAAEYQKAKVEDHEIKVDGKMYDIARVEKQEEQIFVYCVHDAAEDNLLAFLDKILSLPLKDKNIPSDVLQFFSLNYLRTQWSFFTPEFYISQAFTPYAETLSQFTSAKITPPPKV